MITEPNNDSVFESKSIVPEATIRRLPLYVRALSQSIDSGQGSITSIQLGQQLQMTPEQIRKDLAYFGRLGNKRLGYDAQLLEGVLRRALGLNRVWNTALVGTGRLGRAIASYPGFKNEGFEIAAVFDSDKRIIGQQVSGLRVQPTWDLVKLVSGTDIKIGIVAVPVDQAQITIDSLIEAGIGAILNYAPMTPRVPEGIMVRGIDPVLSLQSMTYFLR